MRTFPVIVLLLLAAACTPETTNPNEATEATIEDIGQEVIDLLADGDYEKAHDAYFGASLQDSTSVDDLKKLWEKEANGAYQETISLTASDRGDSYQVVEAEIDATDVIFQLRMTFNEENLLVGINASNSTENVRLPETITEEDVTIGEGTDYPLEGTLTLPEQQHDNLPAIVLVHGSGPSDRDEAVAAYKPFRDLAWGLAEQGIAVLRYDKRTYTYGSSMSQEEVNALTVEEETVEDAVRASELLKNDPRIASNRVYLAGHSQGGMLAPRIDLGGDFAGVAILAGSPRTLWEIIYDQNMAALDNADMDESVLQEQKQLVQQEYEKAQQIKDWTKEEALQETVFGMPAYYFQEMDQYDAGALAADLEKPLLILQGEDDFQVYADKDFALWQDILAKKENATLISYPGLNHFFVDYEGPDEGTVAEYEHPGVVDDQVIQDTAAWILEQAN